MKIDRAGFMRYNGGALKAAPKERFSYMIGIIGAMEIEVAGITAALTDHKTETLCGVTFHTGKLNGTDVVAAKCGVGKVNAAMCTAAMILSYAPSVVINTGVAGGIGEGVKIVFDPTLVRGMGYYTGPIFEVTLDGYNFAIAGGGRYDQMIGKFSGQNVSACGFSIGFERIVTILKDHEQGSFKLPEGSVAYLIGSKAPTARKAEVLAQAAEARKAGVVATVLPMSKNMKHQIELLEAEGFTKFEKIYE